MAKLQEAQVLLDYLYNLLDSNASLDIDLIQYKARVLLALPDTLKFYQDIFAFDRLEDSPIGIFQSYIEAYYRQGWPPSLSLLVAYFVVSGGIQKYNANHVKALCTAAILAEIPSSLPYHNNDHFKNVFVSATFLSKIHQLHEGVVFKTDNLALLFITAFIHDFEHTGVGNTVDGVYVPYYLEKKSYLAAAPYFLSLTSDELEVIYAFLMATDVSPRKSGMSAAFQVRQIFREGALKETKVSFAMDDELMIFSKDIELCFLAIVLQEADILPSAAFSYDSLSTFSQKLKEETDRDFTSPKAKLFFIDHILGKGFVAPATAKLFNDKIKNIRDVIIEQQNS
ncbi:MAG: hypothetical protein CMH30_05165 [Micavibrio sp.]|nr:hypothetical protein [Micavibrio sp.]